MDDLTENDYIVRMPPLREYTVRARVKSVEKAVPPVGVLEDEVQDALNICKCGLAKELCCWDELSDEALVEFEKLIDESAPSMAFLTGLDIGHSIIGTFNDWIDWLMGR